MTNCLLEVAAVLVLLHTGGHLPRTASAPDPGAEAEQGGVAVVDAGREVAVGARLGDGGPTDRAGKTVTHTKPPPTRSTQPNSRAADSVGR